MQQEKRSLGWLDGLTDEDLAFIKRFVLASGSLKDLAAAYGISYPTVRLRLDRLIEKIKIYDDHQITSDFERLLRAWYAEARIDLEMLKALLAAHERELGRADERAGGQPTSNPPGSEEAR